MNENGCADWFWRAPPDAQLSTWQMVAHGVDSNRLFFGFWHIR